MEHYTKGRNEEEELNSGNIPLIGIPEGHGWMLITGRTRSPSESDKFKYEKWYIYLNITKWQNGLTTLQVTDCTWSSMHPYQRWRLPRLESPAEAYENLFISLFCKKKWLFPFWISKHWEIHDKTNPKSSFHRSLFGFAFCHFFSVLAGIGSSIKRVEKLVDMLKQKMKGLFQVQSLISNEQTQLKVQVNKGGERIVREYWDPKSEDLVSML